MLPLHKADTNQFKSSVLPNIEGHEEYAELLNKLKNFSGPKISYTECRVNFNNKISFSKKPSSKNDWHCHREYHQLAFNEISGIIEEDDCADARNISDHESLEEKTPSGGGSPPHQIKEERSLSRSRSRSHSLHKHRSYSRSRSHSRSRRYRHHSKSRSHSPRHRRYSRSGSRSPRETYDDDYGTSRGHSSRYNHSPMSSRRRHMGNRDNPEPSRCLGVFGLSLYTQERELQEMFGRYGPIEDIQVIYDAQSGRSRGFAFVYFEDTKDAKTAKDRCNGKELDGRTIRVDFSITKRAHTPTPGIYMGRPTYPKFASHRDRSYRNHSPSPYYNRHRYSRSRSHSYSPHKYGYY
ncbi:hypothetical protein TNCT_584601 [Trichonephila clavata]|uniref:RRM domain-containing protein n=1 Tax=Trichonephila clavata TaxID=2740835 RepID=A0A8X6FG08_TRICU|nr:hypothetical protein TNCT_584601 [Trichonephila clavata]